MAYLIQASTSELMRLFQPKQVIALNSSAQSLNELRSDLLRTHFLGLQDQAKLWYNETKVEHYSAGNVPQLFNYHPLQQKHETEEEFRKHYRHQEFAYVNDDNQLCGLIIMARADKPSQWMVGLITNTNMSAKERKITLLTSVNLNELIIQPDDVQLNDVQPNDSQSNDSQVFEVDCANSPLSVALKSSFIANLLTLLTQRQGELSDKWQRLSYLLCTINNNAHEVRLNAEPIDLERLAPEDLIADNPILDSITQLKLEPSAAAFLAICDQESTLYQALLGLNDREDNRVKAHLFSMALVFHEHGILSSASAFLDEHVFSKVGGDSFWHEAQIHLIPHLILEEYSAELFQLILSEPAYYEGVLILTELALSQSEDQRALMANVPSLFNQPDKLNELRFIASITDRHCRALCLIFWAKEESSDEKYQNIISQCNDYPYLAASLCARSKQGKSPADLYTELSNPAKHLQHSLIHHIAQQFTHYQLDVTLVKKLESTQLINAHKAFKVIQHAQLADEKKYRLILDNGNDGRLWRLFLPELANAACITDSQHLIHFLYVGIINGTQSQGKIILDESLIAQADELRQRFICVKQMLDLQVPGDDVIRFTANKDNVRSQKLRSIILKVEEECKDIHERISQSRDKYADWQKIETKYRQSLYTIAYEALKKPHINVKELIATAQQEALAVVDPVTTQWWSKVLVAIANSLILLLSCGIANIIKKRQTGSFWFFTPMQPSELIRDLQQKIVDIIDAPEPHSAPG